PDGRRRRVARRADRLTHQSETHRNSPQPQRFRLGHCDYRNMGLPSPGMDETAELRDRVRGLVKTMPGAQREFAAAIGLDETKLSKALNGTRRFSPHELVRVAEHCGVTVNWLLNGSDDALTVTAVPAPAARPASDDPDHLAQS